MSVTIRRRTSKTHNPILAIISAAEKDAATTRVIKGYLMDEPGCTLLVSMTKPADIEEMKQSENVRSSPELLMEAPPGPLRPGEV